jgi:hypothetical protein
VKLKICTLFRQKNRRKKSMPAAIQGQAPLMIEIQSVQLVVDIHPPFAPPADAAWGSPWEDGEMGGLGKGAEGMGVCKKDIFNTHWA